MRVLLISYEYPPIGGGAATAFAELLKRLREQPDLRLDIITTHPRDYCRESILSYMGEGYRITFQSLPIRKANRHYWRASEVASWIWQARGLCKFMLRKYRYDLVHLWSGFPMPLVRWPVLLVISLLGSDVPGFNERLDRRWWYPRLIRYQWTHAAKVVANSTELCQLARHTWLGPMDIIPTGVDTEIFTPAEQPATPRRWLTCGRLIPRKQIDILIGWATSIPDVTLTVAGDGPERTRLERDLPQNIALIGRIENNAMPGLYRTHGLYVHASKHEGLSNSVLEAKASGLPVVDFTNSSAPVLLDRYLTDKEYYRKACRRAKEDADAYSWAATTKAYCDIYKEIVDARRNRH